MDNDQSGDGIVNVLLKHFGIYEAGDLVLRRISLDIKKLTVECGNVSAPFKTKFYTHVQAVNIVDDTLLLWLGCRLPLHFRENEFGFNAEISCGKIFYDIHGLRPIFEGLDPARKLRINPNIQCEVIVYFADDTHP
jgi:hypothetical protein